MEIKWLRKERGQTPNMDISIIFPPYVDNYKGSSLFPTKAHLTVHIQRNFMHFVHERGLTPYFVAMYIAAGRFPPPACIISNWIVDDDCCSRVTSGRFIYSVPGLRVGIK